MCVRKNRKIEACVRMKRNFYLVCSFVFIQLSPTYTEALHIHVVFLFLIYTTYTTKLNHSLGLSINRNTYDDYNQRFLQNYTLTFGLSKSITAFLQYVVITSVKFQLFPQVKIPCLSSL